MQLTREQIVPAPFPHIWVEGGLPDDLYQAAAALWPHVAAPATERMNWSTPETGPWRAVATYCAETLAPQLTDLFAEDIATHRTLLGRQSPFTPEVAAQPLEANDGRWMARQPGYRLRPHVDVGPFFVTVLHYFATPGGSVRDGTRLYQAARPLPASTLAAPRTQYFDEHLIPTTHVKTCPWVPNGCLIFPNRLDAAHGNLVCGKQWRHVYQWHVALPEAKAGRDYQKTVLGVATA